MTVEASGVLCLAGIALLVCVACNLASPVVSGTLFEALVGRQAGNAKTYSQFFVLMASLYITEPLLTRVYIKNICALSEKVNCHMKVQWKLQSQCFLCYLKLDTIRCSASIPGCFDLLTLLVPTTI